MSEEYPGALFLLPLDGQTIVDAYIGCHGHDNVKIEIEMNEAGQPVILIRDQGFRVIEVLEDVPGGSLVRGEMPTGDADEIALLIDELDEACELVRHERAAERAIVFLGMMGGIAASRSRGRYRPIDGGERQLWSRHLVKTNGQKLRGEHLVRKLSPANDQGAGNRRTAV